MSTVSLDHLLKDIRACCICEAHLPLGPRPIVQAHQDAKILVVGQAPGIRVHKSGKPFDDPSGVRLRKWLDMTPEQFYSPRLLAIVPMGFCYPGTGKSGDLPPRPECAPAWREPLLNALPNIELTLILGMYAQAYHLNSKGKRLTDIVAEWKSYWPSQLPLPHPSPRNIAWFKRNPWFEDDVIPVLQQKVYTILKKLSPEGQDPAQI